jgi:photosystem II stability/assembly factor-like uncharacterized protein
LKVVLVISIIILEVVVFVVCSAFAKAEFYSIPSKQYFCPMKNLFLPALLSLVLLISCKENSTSDAVLSSKAARTSVNLELELLASDSISVRALEYRDSVYHYAGSKGAYGSFKTLSKTAEKGVIQTDSLALEFRSIAVTSGFTYLLNAGAPAYIYKIDHETEAVLKVYEEHSENVFYDSLKFWNDDEGIAMGDPTAQGDQQCISILKTYDGGDTWVKIACDRLPAFIDGEAGFAASNSNISIHGDQVWIATGGKAARVLYSKDRGEHWVAQETPIIAGGEMTGIFAMDFYNEKIGVIIGGNWAEKDNNNLNKAITTYGGATWNLMEQGSGPGYCSDIMFVPNTNGAELIAVGTPGIWWSGDQGTTWKKLSDEGFYTVAMQDKNHGMLMGYAKTASFGLR